MRASPPLRPAPPPPRRAAERAAALELGDRLPRQPSDDGRAVGAKVRVSGIVTYSIRMGHGGRPGARQKPPAPRGRRKELLRQAAA